MRLTRRSAAGPVAPAFLVLALLPAACGPAADDADTTDEEAAAAIEAAAPGADAATDGHTADPYALGYTDADFPRVQELAPDIYSYEQIHVAGGETITTVSLFVVTPEGVLVVDGQESPEETALLVETIAGITGQPITHVVIASDHGDHTAGNSAFPQDAEFIAHETSAETLRTQASAPNRPADAAPIVLPTRVVGDHEVIELGGRTIELHHLGRAHTGGDLVVYVPVGKVLFMSETFLPKIFPAMRSAYPSEWVAMLERAQAMDVDVYVPGHGLVESPAILEARLEEYRQAVARVVSEATRLHEAGVSAEDAAGQADFGEIAGWSLESSQASRAIARVYMEIEGELPG